MEDLPVPAWKARDDGIFNLMEEAGCLKKCVDQMLADIVGDPVLITQIAEKLLERQDIIQILAELAESSSQQSPCSAASTEQASGLEWPEDMAEKLEGLMEEEVQQLVAERVWLKLDPELHHEPSVFLMRCVRDAANAFYIGRAADPQLQGIPPIMIRSGGIKKIIDENEPTRLSNGHECPAKIDFPPGFMRKAMNQTKNSDQQLADRYISDPHCEQENTRTKPTPEN